MRVKPGVVFYRWSAKMERVLEIIDEVSWATIGREAHVTSCRDGNHSENSLHYFRHDRKSHGAVDLRTWRGHTTPMQMSGEEKRAYADAIRQALDHAFPGEFDVVAESHHIHVEHDPKEAGPTA
jgi:hypothetical protein